MYHSLLICSLGLEVVGIFFKSLLDYELNSFIGSLDSILRFERSLINVARDLLSPYLVKNYSWKMFQLVMDPDGKENTKIQVILVRYEGKF